MEPSNGEPGNGSGNPLLREVLAWGERIIPRLAMAYPGLGRNEAAAAWSHVVFRWWEKHGGSGELPRPGDLYRNACRRLRDVAKSESARRDREGGWLVGHPGEANGLAARPERLVANDEAVEAAFRATCRDIESLLPEDERLIFPLWLKSKRKTEVYAQALGMPSETPIAEQRKVVRRVKDRLFQRLRRNPAMREKAQAFQKAWEARHSWLE